jgi:hypothetical protein
MAKFSGLQPYLNLVLAGAGVGALVGWGIGRAPGALLGAILGVVIMLAAPLVFAAAVSHRGSGRGKS